MISQDAVIKVFAYTSHRNIKWYNFSKSNLGIYIRYYSTIYILVPPNFMSGHLSKQYKK